MTDDVQRKRARMLELEHELGQLRAELGWDSAHLPGGTLRGTATAKTLGAVLPPNKCEDLRLAAERVAHLGTWTWALETDEVFWSDELYRILGYQRQHVSASSALFFARVHPDDLARVKAAGERGLRAGELEAVEFRILQPAGEPREVLMEGSLLRDATSGRTHFIGTLLDITEQRRAARLLAQTVAELNEAQHMAGLGSWRWELATGRYEWSDGMYRLLELPSTLTPHEELFVRHIHPDELERLAQLRERAVDTRSPPEVVESRLLLGSGEIRQVLYNAMAQYDAAGALVGYRGVMQDITARKQLEGQLHHSQKMEAIGTLAGGVAHDFNNYLMIISGYTELLGQQLSADHPAREAVQGIAEAYQRCAHLTQQLLTLSRRRKARPETLDLCALVQRSATLIGSVLGETIELQLHVQSPGLWIVADPLQVEQVLMNLVVNARDAMAQGGQLRISVQPEVESAGDRAFVRMSVIDAGCGIPHELRSRVFEPFFTTKPVGQGTGLGLSTVDAIVRGAGGSIELDSQPGRGTSIHIAWPRSQSTPSIDAPPADKTAPVVVEANSGRRVLLVEDVARVRELLAAQLERAGYRVLTAPNGLAALQLLEQSQVDLLLSDVVMPQLGGIALAEQVRARHPHVCCLLMTGYSADAVPTNCGENLLRKPFTASELVAAVARALTLRSAG
jgi:two-component system cell cycle sensor histidine kinase/response regulator CckA